MERADRLLDGARQRGPAAESASRGAGAPGRVDLRPQAVARGGLIEAINQGPRGMAQRAFGAAIQNGPRMAAQRQRLQGVFGDAVQLKSIVEAVGQHGTDRIAVAGEHHGELDKNAERGFWGGHGTKVVYEGEVHDLKRSDEQGAETVPTTFDDLYERSLYRIESVVNWIADYNYSGRDIPKGAACTTAGQLATNIRGSADYIARIGEELQAELIHMKRNNEAWKQKGLNPRYTPAQISLVADGAKLITTFVGRSLRALTDPDVARFEGWARTQIGSVASMITSANVMLAEGKTLAGVEPDKTLSVARSESMYANVRVLGGLVSEKSVYKVGDNHARDMQHLLGDAAPDPHFEIKTRGEYLAETGLLHPIPQVAPVRGPGTIAGGADALVAGPKGAKAADVRDQILGD